MGGSQRAPDDMQAGQAEMWQLEGAHMELSSTRVQTKGGERAAKQVNEVVSSS